MKQNITIGEKYTPAMKITNPQEAARYFKECVRHTMGFGKSRKEAEQIERANLGYFAGYYDHETRSRVEQLFACEHPFFGAAAKGVPTPEGALAAGLAAAKGGDAK